MIAGDTPSWTVTVERNGEPVDLTGASINFTAKRYLTDVSAVFQHSTDDGHVVVSPPASAGVAVLTLDAADTADLVTSVAVKLYYDVQVTEADGTISTPITGTLTVYPGVG